MAYVPQFIQTDTSVLQGTLNQYQQGYDTETNRQNQVNDTYSAIPTSQIDTADKNQVMGQFSKVREELDKKYNYDRSNTQYAKELASRITDLRANPLWGHLKDKEELSKMRIQLIAQKGADYHENFNPDSVTVKDANKLQDWKPTDLKDVRESSGLWAKETASNVENEPVISYPVKGMVQFADQTGFRNTTDAANYLNSQAGHDALVQSITARGFDPNDKKVLNEAYTSALSNLVGEVKYTRRDDTNENILARMNAKTGKGSDNSESKLAEVGTSTLTKTPFTSGTEKDVKEKEKTLSVIDTSIKDTEVKLAEAVKNNDSIKIKELNNLKTQQESQKFQYQSDYDKENSIVQNNRTNDVGTKIMSSGADLIKSYLPNIKSEEANNLITKITDSYVLSGGDIEKPVTGALKDVGSFFLDRITHLGGAKGIISSLLSPGQNSLPAAAKAGQKILEKKDAANIVYDLAAAVYKKEVDAGNTENNRKTASGEYNKTAMDKAMKFIENLKNFHDGYGDYVGRGYNVIQKNINDELSAGSVNTFKDLTMVNIKPEDKTEAKNIIVDNIDKFSFVDIKEGKDTGQAIMKDANKLKDIYKNSESTIRFSVDNEGQVLFQLNDPKSNTTSYVKVDPAKSSYDVLSRLQEITKDDRLVSQMFAGFDMADKKDGYDISSSKSYVTNQLGRYFTDDKGNPDLSTFDGWKINKSKGADNGFNYELTTKEGKKYNYANKVDLLNAMGAKRKEINDGIVATSIEMGNSGIKVDLSKIKGIDDYIGAIGQQENRSGNIGVINDRGPNKEPALGLFQFLPSTIKGLGFNVSNGDFLKNKDLQYAVMRKFIQANIDTIGRQGYKIDPNNLTNEAKALLAAAHYGGPGATYALLHNNPWLKKPNPEKKWNTVKGVEEEIVYPSVIDYLQTSMGIDSTKLNFNQSKK